jgi:hypothetical protein
MVSHNRSAPTTEAMSIEWTTSANRTVTCLYSAWASQSPTGEPQLWQTGRSPRAWCQTSATHQRTLSCPDLLPAIATAARPTAGLDGNLDAELVSDGSKPVTCSHIGGAKGIPTPDLLDANESTVAQPGRLSAQTVSTVRNTAGQGVDWVSGHPNRGTSGDQQGDRRTRKWTNHHGWASSISRR